ncbi:GNAT family N-acetyltransferase [Clostridium taeniosporum]|uniref:N-acetyltransferase n=1 Tax=Clostridium taeniosporum TaxID=394958 RepID=A0A1D7XHT6_9CLOT|nr:GNAT family N-acetyltransferase [Clostridium taeniosporum]AOR22914.1 N-acetyltransferase [Clostridium taeniosporum]
MSIKLRNVNKDDCRLLYNWVNDEQVRKSSFKTKKIVYDEHKNWFEEKLNSNNTKIFILEESKQNIGQIRIEIDGSSALIDYSIDKKYRGKGYGIKIIEIIEKEIKKKLPQISTLEAIVKLNNIISQRCFEKNNYNKYLENKYVLYKKEIS